MSKNLEFSLYSPPPSKEEIQICLADGERRLKRLYYTLYLVAIVWLLAFGNFIATSSSISQSASFFAMVVTGVIFLFTFTSRMQCRTDHDWTYRDTRFLSPDECKEALAFREKSPLVDEYLNKVVALRREATTRELQLFRMDAIRLEDQAVKQSLYGESLPC
ncbi:hypothetical protein [Pseudomonas amygdali]|uniref:hypothetical protein n=1 Tax=Pseudomonas amygdali TaxID=47877 RepID=UPI0006E6C5A4|nr:hypothetical protein [Pseudomonas amygdali]KPY55697.1 hypothetical protein ALO93_200210 [Pseudomonas amygdali pv. sesami]